MKRHNIFQQFVIDIDTMYNCISIILCHLKMNNCQHKNKTGI